MSHFYAETSDQVQTESSTRMKKTIEDFGREVTSIRTGRASLSLLDSVRVDHYGTQTPLNQVANLSIPEPTVILIRPWDQSQISSIEKAILVSQLGLHPSNDGKVIRLQIPALTEERRKDLVRLLHNVVEQHRVAARNIRREANEMLKKLLKDKKISEDAQRDNQEKVQKLTDETTAELEKIGKAKEHEIMEI